MKTFQTVAQEMYDNFEQATRDNGTKFYKMTKNIEWQRDIIFAIHLDRMPCDDIYMRIEDLLCNFVECEDEDEARERLFEIEPDCYTADLTNWLSEDVRNVYYLDDAIEMGCKEGFALLATAQKLYIEEIGNELINGIVEQIKNV
jgi:hypothetical protein